MKYKLMSRKNITKRITTNNMMCKWSSKKSMTKPKEQQYCETT